MAIRALTSIYTFHIYFLLLSYLPTLLSLSFAPVFNII